jgi:hypothetical protein
MLIVFSSVAGVCWALSTTHEPTEQPDEVMPQFRLHEQIRDAAIAYISANHSETAHFMTNFAWTVGRTTPENLLGAETYTYQNQGWNVTIHYAVVANPVYSITADYSAQTSPEEFGIPYRIIWEGTWKNGYIIETSYCFAQ